MLKNCATRHVAPFELIQLIYKPCEKPMLGHCLKIN